MSNAARLSAETRALWWCSAGLLAVIVAGLSAPGARDLWTAAKIFALDAVLVLVGGRASRVAAVPALVILFLLLLVASLLLLFVLGYAFTHQVPLGRTSLGVLAAGLLWAVQWQSLRAVKENDRLHD